MFSIKIMIRYRHAHFRSQVETYLGLQISIKTRRGWAMEGDENASKAIHLERNAVLWWMDPERLKYAFGAGVCRWQGLE